MSGLESFGRERGAGAKLRKRLENPFALGVQGFVFGCILFVTLHPFAGEPAPAPSGGGGGGGSMLSGLEA